MPGRGTSPALVVAILSCLLAPARAAAAAAGDAFANATRLESAGRTEESARAFESVALEDPRSERAAEALFRAATLSDRSLGSYRAAIDLYERTARAYPESRFARKAGLRREQLERYAVPDEAAFRTYEKAVQKGSPDRTNREEYRQALLTVIERHAASPVVPLALMALGRELEKEGDIDGARRRFQEILDRHPGAGADAEARAELGDLTFQEGRYEEAMILYSRLAEGPPGPWQGAGAELTRRARDHLFRRRVFRLCAASMALFAAVVIAGTPWRTVRLRAVRWPWAEFASLAVLSTPFLLLAHQKGRGFFVSVVLCELGSGAAVLLMTTLRLSVSPPRGAAWRVLFTLSALAATAAAGYSVLYAFDLAFLLDQLPGRP